MDTHRSWKFWVWRVARPILIIYVALLILGFLLQRHLIYFPSRASENKLVELAQKLGLHPWRDAKGNLIGWRSERREAHPKPTNRVVVFHGNAGYALHRLYYVEGFQGASGAEKTWEVFLFEYPGYGARPGTRSEGNITNAAREAIQELLQEDDMRSLYLAGESLGSSFASRLASENAQRIAGVLLVTPLTSLADVAAIHYPFLPVRWILREHHNVREYLAAYPGPVAFLIAGRDEIMKNGIGHRLYREYHGRKRLWLQPDAGHNTLDLAAGSRWWSEVTDFLTGKNAQNKGG